MQILKNKTWLKKLLALLAVGALLAVVLAVVVPFFTHSGIAFAAGEETTLEEATSKLLSNLQGIVSIFLKLLNYLLWPILMIIGALMDNNLIVGPGMEQALLTIWREVRNIINILFAVVLLVVAIYNVLGLGEEGPLSGYAFKKILPRFLTAIILVNFSFVISKLVLDAADLMTNAVFALPSAGVEEFKAAELAKDICPTLFPAEPAAPDAAGSAPAAAAASAPSAEDDSAIEKALKKKQLCATKDTFTDDAIKFFQQGLNSNTAALMLAINMGQLHKQMYPQGNDKALEELGAAAEAAKQKDFKFTDLLINSLFSLLFFIVYTITFVILALVLLVRIVVLWFIVALSPLIALSVILPEELGTMQEFDLKDMFLKHTFAPVIIAFSMSIGFFMLNAYKTIGAVNVSEPALFELGVAISGVSDVHKLIIAIGAIVVVWVGTFAAAKGTVIENITEDLKQTLQTWGKELATSFKYATIMPTLKSKDGKEGKKISLAKMVEGFRNPAGTVRGWIEPAAAGAGAAGAVAAMVPNDVKGLLRRIADENWRPEAWQKILSGVAQHPDDYAIRQEFVAKLKETYEKKPETITRLKAENWLNGSQIDSLATKIKESGRLEPAEAQRILGPKAIEAAQAAKATPAGETPAAAETPAQTPKAEKPQAFQDTQELQTVLSSSIDQNAFNRLTETKRASAGELKEVAEALHSLGLQKLQNLQMNGGLQPLLAYEAPERAIIIKALEKAPVDQVDDLFSAIKNNNAGTITDTALKTVAQTAIDALK